jgi:hypothetical protein
LETAEHKGIKEKMKQLLSTWFSGVSTKEHPYSGQELDCFDALYNGVTIMVEVIWTKSPTNFYKDLDIIQNADAKIKIVIVNPKILQNEKLLRHFEKVRISQILQGHLMTGLLDGHRFMKEYKYKFWVKEIIQEFLTHISADLNQSKSHFWRIKELVIKPALSLIERKQTLPDPNHVSEEFPSQLVNLNQNNEDQFQDLSFDVRIDSTYNPIDRQLLKDFIDYHYIETIKIPWTEYRKHSLKRDEYHNKINENIEMFLKKGLDSNGIKQRVSIYEGYSQIDTIPIKEVTECLRILIENGQNYELQTIQQIFKTFPGEIHIDHPQYPSLIKIYYSKDDENVKKTYDLLCGILLKIINDKQVLNLVASHKIHVKKAEESSPKLRELLNWLLNKESLNKPSCEFLMP